MKSRYAGNDKLFLIATWWHTKDHVKLDIASPSETFGNIRLIGDEEVYSDPYGIHLRDVVNHLMNRRDYPPRSQYGAGFKMNFNEDGVKLHKSPNFEIFLPRNQETQFTNDLYEFYMSNAQSE